MKKNQYGRIIFVISPSAVFPYPYRAHSVSAKGGMLALARSMALEVGVHGITVNSVAPGWITTERNPDWFPELEETYRHAEETIPLRRLGTAQDIANACLFFSSGLANWVTGQMMFVNGGEHMV